MSADAVLPGDVPPKEYMKRFKGDPEIEALVTGIWQGLRNVREFGSLLHPERAIDEVIRRRAQADSQKYPMLQRGETEWARWKADLLHGLREEFEKQAQSQDLGQRLFGEDAAKGVSLVEALGNNYDVVVTNPPYAGGKNLGSRLRGFIDQHFKEGKRDIYTAFIVRCMQFCRTNAYLGMVTQHSWMFLGAFEELRIKFLREFELTTLSHLGPKTFKDLSNTNALGFCIFTGSKRPAKETSQCVFFRLVHAEKKQPVLVAALSNYDAGRISPSSRVFIVSQISLVQVPHASISYWAPPMVLSLLSSGQYMSSIADAKQGLITGDNDRFLRQFWEVSETNGNWMPYMKGGAYCRWFGNTDLIVNWHENGIAIRTLKGSSGRIKSRPQNVSYYGREGATWTAQSSYGLSMRLMPEGFFFDAKGPGLFAHDECDLIPLIGLFNTNILHFLYRLIQPTVDFGEGYLLSIPFPDDYKTSLVWSTMNHLSSQALQLKQDIAQHLMTERVFHNEPTEIVGESLGSVSTRVMYKRLEQLAAIHLIEGSLAEHVADFYGLSPEDRQSIIDELGLPAYWQPLIHGYDKSLGRSETREENAKSERWGRLKLSAEQVEDLRKNLRCLFEARLTEERGEMSVTSITTDELVTTDLENDDSNAIVSGRAPFPTETLLEEFAQDLKIHPLSIYELLKEMHDQENLTCLSEMRNYIENYASTSILRLLGYRWPEQDAYEREHGPIIEPSLVVEDGIIPLVPCGDQPTAAELVRRRLERDFGDEGASKSEAEFRQWVGRSIEDWLLKDFFRRHVQQFKQRPIVWHLISPERTIKVFVLYHKLNRATLQKLRAQYAGGLIARLQAEQARAKARGDTANVSRLQIQIEDVEEFRSLIEAIERGEELQYRIRCRWKGEEDNGRPGPYAPDIDDGVKVNIRPFQEAGLLAVKEVIKKW